MASKSLYSLIYSLWSYIFPSDVIAAEAEYLSHLTLVSVTVLVILPLILLFLCILNMIVKSIRRE